VLTESDYKELERHGRALAGVVQALMLTGHLLFVGFSLAEKDFLALATGVRQVRQQADTDAGRETTFAGTALALTPDDIKQDAWREDLRLVSMTNTSDKGSAARTLEIFLDCLAWNVSKLRPAAAQYLLDERYDAGFTDPADVALRDALRRLLAEMPTTATNSAGWPTVRRALEELGMDREKLSPRTRSADETPPR
jgi:hypothetical protein